MKMQPMNLLDLIKRPSDPLPWSLGEKIPWNEPGFSERMLNEHLSQEHNAASRRFEWIDQHVDWIHTHILGRRSATILDLGCGPGLYSSRLAKLGHQCAGIDFSPASIAHAKAQAQAENLACTYRLGDIRQEIYGGPYDLAMLIYGEFNVFRPNESGAILQKIFKALKLGGIVLLEPHTFEAVETIGKEPPSWYTTESGLFSEHPHVCLKENNWHAEYNAATVRHHILKADTGFITTNAMSVQAYTNDEYRILLQNAGFVEPDFYPGLGDSPKVHQPELIAVMARKANL